MVARHALSFRSVPKTLPAELKQGARATIRCPGGVGSGGPAPQVRADGHEMGGTLSSWGAVMNDCEFGATA